tara:strand:+ start:1277 stop:2383 length:1107 start_codon:yes stop_codon:yes gene_type:complete
MNYSNIIKTIINMGQKKTALISGITGQDGSYLAELLLSKGYIIHGIIRRSSSENTSRIDHLINNNSMNGTQINIHYGDITDASNIVNLINHIEPDEIYNLAAQSHVGLSFDVPEYTAQTDALGPLRILEAIRTLGLKNKTRVYQASTSELYGLVQETPQSEETPFYPRSPYAVAKLYAYWITVNYREAHNLYACNGILFNHESPRRGTNFVTRKITKGLAQIEYGLSNCLYMGNLESMRDWGHAKDYVEMQWRMLQQEKPEDYVIATGQQSSVRKFIEMSACQLDWGGINWEGSGVNEIGKRKDNGEVVIRVDPKFFRPSEVSSLLGNPTKAHKKLGWKPSISLEQLVKEMIESDKKEAQKIALIQKN